MELNKATECNWIVLPKNRNPLTVSLGFQTRRTQKCGAVGALLGKCIVVVVLSYCLEAVQT